MERVTDNLAALNFHSAGGDGGDAQAQDQEKEKKQQGDFAAVATRVEAAAAAADPTLGAAYASRVAEGMQAALSGAPAPAAAGAGERVAGQRFTLPPGVKDRRSCAFVWVGGGESPALTQALALLHGQCRGIAQFDPATRQLCAEATGTAQVSRVVKRR